MKTFKYLVLFVYVILITQINGQSQAGAFLNRSVDSRALAMGGAYTSVTDGASSIYWNPAGLNGISNNDFSAMFSSLTLDRKEYFVAYGHTFKSGTSFGAGWYKFGVSDIDGRDLSGQKTEMFDDSENSIMLSVSHGFSFGDIGDFSFGVTGKYLIHNLADRSASGYGFDAGIMTTLYDIVRVGLVAQNIASSLKWDTENSTKENIPLTLRLGISVYPSFFPFGVSADIVQIGDSDPVFRFGIGAQVVKYFGLRAGYDANNPTFGAFLWYPISDLTVQIDYAATKDILQDNYVHHFTLAFRF